MLKDNSKMEQRYDAVTMVMRDGFSITEIAAKFNVSRQTIYRWLAKYEEGGLEALGEESHRPHQVTDSTLEVWDGNEFLKAVLRTTKGEVRKKRAQRSTKKEQ